MNTEIINQLQQEKDKAAENLKKQLEEKNRELQQEKDKAAENLKKQLEEKNRELHWKNTEIIKQVKETVEILKIQLENKNLEGQTDTEIIKQLEEVKRTAEKLKDQLESKNQEMLQAEKTRNDETERKLKELVKQLKEEKTKTEKELNELVKQLEDEKKKKTEENLKELVKQLKEEKTEQQMNKLQKGDIILDKVDGHGPYICLKNTSSEDKMMTGWELKLQINNRNPDTYKFERNFTLKARKGLTLHRFSGTRGPYPDNTHLRWADMSSWNSRDNVKINFMSNTGEEHRLM